jgi:hypothetical protein
MGIYGYPGSDSLAGTEILLSVDSLSPSPQRDQHRGIFSGSAPKHDRHRGIFSGSAPRLNPADDV